MIDISTLPSRLPSFRDQNEVLEIQRLAPKHCESLALASQQAVHHVKPWLGTSLCPLTPAQCKQFIETIEQQRKQGYGIVYLLMNQQTCLGMGIINYIHPVHLTANLGYWLVPQACGRGLASQLAYSLVKMAFSQMGLHRIELLIEPANKASLRTAEKLNAQREGLCRKRVFGRDALLYSITPA